MTYAERCQEVADALDDLALMVRRCASGTEDSRADLKGSEHVARVPYSGFMIRVGVDEIINGPDEGDGSDD